MARGVIEEVEEVPEKGVLMGMNALGYTFIVTALAAAIAWIVYVAKSVNNDTVGSNDAGAELETITVCFQAVVASVLLYFVARHHFSTTHF